MRWDFSTVGNHSQWVGAWTFPNPQAAVGEGRDPSRLEINSGLAGDDKRLFSNANRHIQQLQEKVHLPISLPSGNRSHQNHVSGSTGNTGIDQFWPVPAV